MGRRASHGWPAEVLRAYAASIGKDVRTAQRHAAAGNAEFLRFAQVSAVEGVKPREVTMTVVTESHAMAPPEAPKEVDVPDAELSETGQLLKATWLMWAEHYARWKYNRGGFRDALGKLVEPNDAMMCVHAKLIMDLRKAFMDAQTKHQQWEIDNRRLIPANEFHTFRAEFLIPLRNILKNMPAEMAGLVNPHNQSQAIEGGRQYLQQRLMPQIQRMLDGMSNLTPKAA